MGTGITIGNFDGVHLGHQQLIHALKANPQITRIVAITFDPHPTNVLQGEGRLKLIQSLEERVASLKAFGATEVKVLHFDSALASMSARDFAEEYVFSEANLKCVTVGKDFVFGKKRSGTPQLLQAWCAEKHLLCIITEDVLVHGERVSSTRIRHAIETGDLVLARECLGRAFSISGTVVKGDQRGRLLGFPTANFHLSLTEERARCLPPKGVYATQATIASTGSTFSAVTNLGNRPTFGNHLELRVETHLLDVTKDLYGETLVVDFFDTLRPEMRFSGPESLSQQIQIDISKRRNLKP